MRAIVTGGAGFIGSHVVDALVARGDEVVVLDDLSRGKRGERERRRRARRRRHPRRRTRSREAFGEARPEACFHLAAQADVRVSVERPDFDAEVNVLGTIRLLEAAREHGTRIVFASTGGAIYGECAEPATETAPRAPLSPVRDLEARGRGVPRDLQPPLRERAHARSASATSTARARTRTARPASSPSSSGGWRTARRRTSSATARSSATTSTSATSPPSTARRARPARPASSTSARGWPRRCSSSSRPAGAPSGVDVEPVFDPPRLGRAAAQRPRRRPRGAGARLRARARRSPTGSRPPGSSSGGLRRKERAATGRTRPARGSSRRPPSYPALALRSVRRGLRRHRRAARSCSSSGIWLFGKFFSDEVAKATDPTTVAQVAVERELKARGQLPRHRERARRRGRGRSSRAARRPCSC